MPAQHVHVVLVGWEYDRALKPFTLKASNPNRQNAHKVYLVVPGASNDKGFTKKIARALDASDIKVETIEIERERGGQSIEFQQTLAAVAGICHREAFRAGHRVHINISSGSKIGAFAAGLAAMAYQQTGKVTIYYVQPDGYTANLEGDEREKEEKRTGLSFGVRHVLDLELMPLVQCNRAQLQALAFLRKSNGRASLTEILLHLIAYKEGQLQDFVDLLPPAVAKSKGIGQTPLAEHRSARGAPYGALRELQAKALGRQRTLLRILQEQGWVKQVTSGRRQLLELTEPGQIFALLAQDES